MTIRQILVDVWQKNITPGEALEDLERNGYKLGFSNEEVLDMLKAVAKKDMNVAAFLRAVGQEQRSQANRR